MRTVAVLPLYTTLTVSPSTTSLTVTFVAVFGSAASAVQLQQFETIDR
ncbi:hypothetical protein M3221_18210 [Domibacillus indicus]|nr:hypothetical protein [Domibacillus indicus]MCM3790315.1 hypothetical protein [Domibacillus indicus]